MFHTRNYILPMLTYLYQELVTRTHLEVAVSEKYSPWLRRYIQATLVHFLVSVVSLWLSLLNGMWVERCRTIAMHEPKNSLTFDFLALFETLKHKSLENLEAMFWIYYHHKIEGTWILVLIYISVSLLASTLFTREYLTRSGDMFCPGRCYWSLVGGDCRCCYMSCKNILPQQRII